MEKTYRMVKDQYLAQADIYLGDSLMAKGLQIDFAAYVVRTLNAAPELLEVLKTLRRDSALGMGQKWAEACEKADALIAKAEGR